MPVPTASRRAPLSFVEVVGDAPVFVSVAVCDAPVLASVAVCDAPADEPLPAEGAVVTPVGSAPSPCTTNPDAVSVTTADWVGEPSTAATTVQTAMPLLMPQPSERDTPIAGSSYTTYASVGPATSVARRRNYG